MRNVENISISVLTYDVLASLINYNKTGLKQTVDTMFVHYT